MATEQTNITEAIVQVTAGAARVAVQSTAVAGAENSTRHEGTQNAGPKIGGLVMKHPTFKVKAEDQYN